jgi:hypothetical protein
LGAGRFVFVGLFQDGPASCTLPYSRPVLSWEERQSLFLQGLESFGLRFGAVECNFVH